jgi:hypothetical protein
MWRARGLLDVKPPLETWRPSTSPQTPDSIQMAGILAMMDGRYDEAREYFLAPRRHNILSTRRYSAVSLALLLRLDQTSLRHELEQGRSRSSCSSCTMPESALAVRIRLSRRFGAHWC